MKINKKRMQANLEAFYENVSEAGSNANRASGEASYICAIVRRVMEDPEYLDWSGDEARKQVRRSREQIEVAVAALPKALEAIQQIEVALQEDAS